ncbi:hypothetical protein C5167_021510 [Papaver somniferum]|nr:hypothetical protein C5167_021510 [Papaver somniferum]
MQIQNEILLRFQEVTKRARYVSVDFRRRWWSVWYFKPEATDLYACLTKRLIFHTITLPDRSSDP